MRSLPPGAAAVAHLELELLGFGAGVSGFGLANIVNAYKLARSDPERHAVVRLEDVQKGGASFDAAWRDAIEFVTPGLGPDASASALEAARTEDLTRHADAKGAAHATAGPGAGGIGVESAEDAREARCALLTHEAFGPMLRWFRTASGYPETTDAERRGGGGGGAGAEAPQGAGGGGEGRREGGGARVAGDVGAAPERERGDRSRLAVDDVHIFHSRAQSARRDELQKRRIRAILVARRSRRSPLS